MGFFPRVEVIFAVMFFRRQEADACSLITRNTHHREHLLRKVSDFWISGVLEQPLFGAAFIDLGLREQPDAVKHSESWSFVLEQSDQPSLKLPPKTSITQIYTQADW